MKNIFLESGKALLIFGNLGTILLFLRDFLIADNYNSLIMAVLFFIISYTVGNILIYVSNFYKE